MLGVFQRCTKLFNFKVLSLEPEMYVTHVLLTCENFNEDNLCQKIRKMNHMTDVSRIFGAYNIIVKMESDSEKEIRDTISSPVRQLENIEYTMTLTSTGN